MVDNKIWAVIILSIIAISMSSLNLFVMWNNYVLQTNELRNLRTDIGETNDEIATIDNSLSGIENSLNNLNTTHLEKMVETLRSNLTSLEDELENINQSIVVQTPGKVYESTYRSVVVVRTPSGLGSGFIYREENMVLTNWHVVADDTDIEVEFYDRSRSKANLIGSDPYSDVAVLELVQVPPDIMPLQLGDSSEVWIGEQVVAIGNPLGLTGSLSAGYISQINKLIDLQPLIVPVLQLDVTIAPGNSGGPLLDLQGNVIGITNAGTDVGFNFAIPSNIIVRAASSIIEKGYYEHPFVGFMGVELTPESISELNILNVEAFQSGFLVWEVIPGTPAEEAGLRGVVATTASDGSQAYEAMDIILEVDGHSVFNSQDWASYIEENVSPGQTITLTLWRSGQISHLDIETTTRPDF